MTVYSTSVLRMQKGLNYISSFCSLPETHSGSRKGTGSEMEEESSPTLRPTSEKMSFSCSSWDQPPNLLHFYWDRIARLLQGCYAGDAVQ